jgi:hypothetical protein
MYHNNKLPPLPHIAPSLPIGNPTIIFVSFYENIAIKTYMLFFVRGTTFVFSKFFQKKSEPIVFNLDSNAIEPVFMLEVSIGLQKQTGATLHLMWRHNNMNGK